MDQEKIVNELIGYIENDLAGIRRNGSVSADDDLLGSGLVDSMGVMKLVGHIESEYGINVSPEEIIIENFADAKTIAKFVLGKQTSD